MPVWTCRSVWFATNPVETLADGALTLCQERGTSISSCFGLILSCWLVFCRVGLFSAVVDLSRARNVGAAFVVAYVAKSRAGVTFSGLCWWY